jgi:vacuolar protein sorting-associated protein 26
LALPQCDIKIFLDDEEKRKMVKVTHHAGKEQRDAFPLYFDGEAIRGRVRSLAPWFTVGATACQGRKTGGTCGNQGGIHWTNRYASAFPPPNRVPPELFHDRGKHYEFLALQQELATPGELKHTVSYDFEFKNVEKQYESYSGANAKLRYAQST